MESLKFKGELDASEVKDGLQEINENLDETKKKARSVRGEMDGMRDGGKKKDWKSLLDIFGSVLPRGLQRTIRGFQGTARAVKRASVSFKALGTAIAAIGLPLLIAGLTWLIDNWEKVSDWFSGTTEGMKELAAATERATDATREFRATNDVLMRQIEGTTSTIENRIAAYEELSRVLVEAHNIDVTTAEGQARIRELYDERLRQEELMTLQREQQNALASAKKRLDEADYNWNKSKYLDLQEDVRRAQRALNETTEEYLGIRTEQMKRADEYKAQLEAEAQAKRDAAEAEAARKRAEDEALRSREAGNKMIQEHAYWERTVGLEGLELQEMQRTIAYEKEIEQTKKTILDRTQRNIILKNLEEQYQTDIEQLRFDAAERQRLEDEADAQRAKEQADQKYIQQQDAEDKLQQFLEQSQLEGIERERQTAIDALVSKYEAMFLTAADNEELYRNLIEQQRLDMLALNAKYDEEELAQARKTAEEDARLIETRISARNRFVDTAVGAVGAIIKSGKDNEEAQKRLAVVEILLQQGQAFAAALRGAASAAAQQGAAAPFALPLYIAQMVGAITVGFAQVKNIMSQADADAGAIGTQPARTSTAVQTLVPTRGSADMLKKSPVQAYVVQSQLQGQNMLSKQLNGLSSL